MKQGYIQVYTGNGKGKTTAAIGLAIRCAGAKKKVIIAQFLKAKPTSEINILKQIDNIKILRNTTCKKFFWHLNDTEKELLKKETNDLLKLTLKYANSNNYDIIIFDEILGTLSLRLLSKDDIISLIDSKPAHCEYILTGRDAPKWLIDRSDLVSEINPIKHYMDTGVCAREGIEY